MRETTKWQTAQIVRWSFAIGFPSLMGKWVWVRYSPLTTGNLDENRNYITNLEWAPGIPLRVREGDLRLGDEFVGSEEVSMIPYDQWSNDKEGK